MPALCLAIKNKRFRQAKILIEMGTNVNAREANHRRTPLMELCLLEEETKAAKIGKLLLGNGALVGLKDRLGMNALHYACKYGREQLVSVMLDECHTFDPNSFDKERNTALHFAALSGNFVVLNLLMKTLKRFKLSVDKKNIRGETPLICASKAGHFLCARILVSEGRASKHARDQIDFKNASEWEQTKESLNSAAKSPLFMTLQLKPRDASSQRSSLDLNESTDQKQRPYTAPVRGELTKPPKNHKDDLKQLFNFYEGQFSPAFRPGVKPKPSIVETTITEDTMSENSEQSESTDCMSPFDRLSPLTRRFSVNKTANIALSTSNSFRRRSIATTGLSNTPTRRQSLTSPVDSRRSSQFANTPKIRRGSINVIAKLNVNPQIPMQNSSGNSPRGRRGSLDVRNKGNQPTRSTGFRSRSPFSESKLMSKLQTLTEASDDEDESEVDLLQRSSPAAMQTMNE